MNINVAWYSSDCRVIYWRFRPHWTWDDYYVALDKSCRLAASVEHRVDVIGSVHISTMLPAGVLVAYKTTAQNLPENVRSIAVVGANIWIRAMVTGLRCIDPRLGKKIFFTDTLCQAQRLLGKACQPSAVGSTRMRAGYTATSEIFP